MSEPQISVAFGLIAELAIATNAAPVRDKIWTHKVDEHWTVKINGFKDEREDIPPFSAYVEFNGWPAGIINPFGGYIAVGSVANERSFCEALEAAIVKAKESISLD